MCSQVRRSIGPSGFGEVAFECAGELDVGYHHAAA
jgi:hypothetical protein